MVKASKLGNKAALALVLLSAALFVPSGARAAAGGFQKCTPSSSCEVGEFLFDDEYLPITTATCTITSRNPDGTVFINNQTMTAAAENDGWYSYGFTTPATEGTYRTQVCCTVGSEYLCVDKTFENKTSASGGGASAESIATAVWAYSNRTLSTFGSLISSIWSSATRTLTGTGLDSGQLATQDDVVSVRNKVDTLDTKVTTQTTDVTSLTATVNESRLLLEQLVNKPIIENVLEEEVPDLGEKLKQTRAVANQLYVNSQYLTSESGSVVSKWGITLSRDVVDKTIALNDLLGDETDSSSANTIFGQINWMRDSWNWDVAENLYIQAKAAKKALALARTTAGSYGKSDSVYQSFRELTRTANSLAKLVGTTTDTSFSTTLYSQIKETEEVVALWDTRNAEADKLLASWNKTKDPEKTLKPAIADLERKVVASNRIPKITSILQKIVSSDSPLKALKNSLLRLKGVIESNKKFLAKGAGATLTNTWLEEGSLIFKTLATNPSNLINQEVDIKYYLPQEVREEDILEADSGLSVKYDPEKDQYYVDGNFTLAAGETRAFSVKVDDIWAVSETEVESLRSQAEELARPLERTSYFAQGVTLKSNINSSLDKILTLQEAAVTPEQKIRAYREAGIEKSSVEDNIAALQALTTQAGATGTLFGFVGGAQAIAVWGLIIVMAAGFVFLALYFRTISGGNGKKKDKKTKAKSKKVKEASSEPRFMGTVKKLAPFAVVAMISSTVSGVVVGGLVIKAMKDQVVLGETAEVDTQSPPVIENEFLEEVPEEPIEPKDMVTVVVPAGRRVNVRLEPSLEAEIITRFEATREVERLGASGTWTNIAFSLEGALEEASEGWISSQFIEELGEAEVSSSLDEESAVLGTYETLGPVLEAKNNHQYSGEDSVTILETSTGWLRVRSAPSGQEVGRVYPGETYRLVEEVSGWYRIELDDGAGWISSQYANK